MNYEQLLDSIAGVHQPQIRKSVIGESPKSGISATASRKSAPATPTPLSARALQALSWTQFLEFIRLDEPWKLAFYDNECLKDLTFSITGACVAPPANLSSICANRLWLQRSSPLLFPTNMGKSWA